MPTRRTPKMIFAAALASLAGLLAIATPALGQANGMALASAGSAKPVASPAGPAESLDADGPRVKMDEHSTVELHVKNEDLANVLQLLGFEAKRNIIVTKNVSAKISADLYSATFYEALDAILHPNGFAYVERGNFIYIYTIEELEKIEATLRKRVAKKITLNYLNAPDAAEFVKGMLSKEGEIKTTAKTDDFAIGSDVPVGKDSF
ncbi:MAG: hypothetical protein ACK5TP_03045, partial [bacterium]